MAWVGLIRVWNPEERRSRSLRVSIENGDQAGCLLRLYDKETVVGEETGEDPKAVLLKLLEVARRYLNDPNIGESSIEWVQSTSSGE